MVWLARLFVEVALAVTAGVIFDVDVDALLVAAVVVAESDAQRRFDDVDFRCVAPQRLETGAVTSNLNIHLLETLSINLLMPLLLLLALRYYLLSTCKEKG